MICENCGDTVHSKEEAENHDCQRNHIQVYRFNLEISVGVPATSEEAAINQMEDWSQVSQNSVGGLAFSIKSIECLSETNAKGEEK